MAERVVVDASVAIAILRDEIGSSAARSLARSWAGLPHDLLVPSHFWLEITNALVRFRGQASLTATEGLIALDGMGLQTIDLDRPLLLAAIDAVVRFGLSTYDATYLALAQTIDARLATLDRGLAVAAVAAGITVEPDAPGRVSEAREAYHSEVSPSVDWAHSAVVGAHIAELRRRAIAGT